MEKFVVIDGAKFEADDKGEVVKDDKGNPKPYVDPNAGGGQGGGDDKGKGGEGSMADLAELAKTNPAVKKLMDEKADADKKLADAATAEEERQRKEMEAKGEHQKIADAEKTKREKAEADLARANDLLGKAQATIGSALKNLLAEIPDDKKSLIPKGFSERQQFEYIVENAEQLGVKSALFKKGGKVPANEDNPQDDDVVKQKRFDELVAKKGKTREEETEMLNLAKDLKAAKLKKQADKEADKK